MSTSQAVGSHPLDLQESHNTKGSNINSYNTTEWSKKGETRDVLFESGRNRALGYLGRITAFVIIVHPGAGIGGIWNLLVRYPFNSCTVNIVTNLETQKHRV